MKTLHYVLFLCLFACSASGFASVAVTSPSNGSTVASSVHYVATSSAPCSKGVAAMGVYVNNRLAYVSQGASLNTTLTLAPGTYNTVVQEWDYCNGATYSPVRITVASASGSAAPVGSNGVSVSLPANNSTVSSPVNFVASAAAAACPKGVAAMGIYVNNSRIYVAGGASLNTKLNLGAGAQRAVVQEWDYCGGSSYTAVNLNVGAPTSGTPTATGTPLSRHVVMVTEENQGYSTVVQNTNDWPNVNNLIGNGALATNYYADTHPSIGNYFMMTTGQIITNDDNSTAVENVDNIARRMLAAGVSFKIYSESVGQGYLGGNTSLYLIRHNPFALLSDIAGNQQVANQTLWPFSQFLADAANGNLPEFSFIVPNIDDDAHNGTPRQADTWLEQNVVLPLSNNREFQSGGDGLLIVNFDEGASTDGAYGGGHISPVFWGPNVKVGYTQQSGTVYQHQSILRTVMDSLGLANPPGAAAAAPPMTEFFK